MVALLTHFIWYWLRSDESCLLSQVTVGTFYRCGG